MLKANKGEWSEIYVLLKLLSKGNIFGADEDLNELNDVWFPILKIIREENKETVTEFVTGDPIEININGKLVVKIPKNEFHNEADHLLNAIISTKSKGAFGNPRTEKFMDHIKCYKISAPSTDKSDIKMQIIDINTGYKPTVGFSIKSELGSSPTLLNAGKTTNFKYAIKNSSKDLIKETNNLYTSAGKVSVRDRTHRIEDSESKLLYSDMTNNIFKNNLVLIDSLMDKIIAQTLLYYYHDGIADCLDLVNKLKAENPMNYGNINAYEYKFKKFLTAIALGMKPATPWNGLDEASGGYIIVTRKGNVVAYHIYNRNFFEEYLLKNTKYETPSTSRHGFGSIYEENYGKYFNLNLQIRFK